MSPTSGYRAGTAASFMPVKGHSITLAPHCSRVSVPSIERAGRKGTPMAAAL